MDVRNKIINYMHILTPIPWQVLDSPLHSHI